MIILKKYLYPPFTISTLREARSSGGFTLKEGGAHDQKVGVRVGLDTGFMALVSIYIYILEMYI